MRDKAANAADQAAPLTRALVVLCISIGASDTFAQLSDPMAPPGAASADGTQAGARTGAPSELQAIISGPTRRLALIDGSVVQVGETIPGNGQLLNVGLNSATVLSGDKKVLLRLYPDLPKKGATP